VPGIIPESDDDIKFFASALRRSHFRSQLARKMKQDDATELKALFVKD